MDVQGRIRVRFALINLGWSAIVVLLAATAAITAAVLLDWSQTWLYAIFGLAAGMAIGVIRDRTVFQAVLGATGILLISFALYWSTNGINGFSAEAATLLATAAFAFFTAFTLSRIWGRPRPPLELNTEDLDKAVAHPRAGG